MRLGCIFASKYKILISKYKILISKYKILIGQSLRNTTDKYIAMMMANTNNILAYC